MRGYGPISCLTVIRLPLLTSDGRIMYLSGIPLFEPFLELLSSKLLQHNIGIKHRTTTSVIMVQGTKTTKFILVPIFSFDHKQL